MVDAGEAPVGRQRAQLALQAAGTPNCCWPRKRACASGPASPPPAPALGPSAVWNGDPSGRSRPSSLAAGLPLSPAQGSGAGRRAGVTRRPSAPPSAVQTAAWWLPAARATAHPLRPGFLTVVALGRARRELDLFDRRQVRRHGLAPALALPGCAPGAVRVLVRAQPRRLRRRGALVARLQRAGHRCRPPWPPAPLPLDPLGARRAGGRSCCQMRVAVGVCAAPAALPPSTMRWHAIGNPLQGMRAGPARWSAYLNVQLEHGEGTRAGACVLAVGTAAPPPKDLNGCLH